MNTLRSQISDWGAGGSLKADGEGSWKLLQNELNG